MLNVGNRVELGIAREVVPVPIESTLPHVGHALPFIAMCTEQMIIRYFIHMINDFWLISGQVYLGR